MDNDYDKIYTAQILCDESLLFFTQYFFKRLRNQKFITNWHHEDICTYFDKVQNYELEFLGLNMPPRMSKTELLINFIARGLGQNQSANYLYITASDELRSETSTRIRDIVSDEHFKIMYGLELKKDQNAKNLWRTTHGGGLKTATIFGQITGFGAGQMKEHKDLIDYVRDFEGCIALDDINKMDDAEVMTAVNTKVLRVIGNTVLSRKNSADTPIVNIQQRAGIEDATNYFDKLFVNNKKAINLVYPIIYKDKPLWEWKFPMDKIQEIKNNPETSYIFDTQYMQDPQPKEGLMFHKSELKYYESLSDMEGVTIAYADCADEGIDFFSMPIVKIITGKAYVIDVLFNQYNLSVNKSHVLAMIDKHNIDHLFIESNSFGAFFIREMREITKVPVKPIKNTTNKLARIMAQSGWIIENFYFMEDYNNHEDYRKFMQQVTRYLKNGKEKKDDAPDSLAGLSYVFRVLFKSLFN